MAKSAVAQMDDKSVGGKLKAWPARGKSFLADVRTELRHVTAPSRKEVQATTVVVVITVALFGVYFWGVDLLISNAMNLILKHKF
jgi:preprotein translocase subunit SecE